MSMDAVASTCLASSEVSAWARLVSQQPAGDPIAGPADGGELTQDSQAGFSGTFIDSPSHAVVIEPVQQQEVRSFCPVIRQ
jgi:hypothetical protein